jgi:hypothetical protein
MLRVRPRFAGARERPIFAGRSIHEFRSDFHELRPHSPVTTREPTRWRLPAGKSRRTFSPLIVRYWGGRDSANPEAETLFSGSAEVVANLQPSLFSL